MDVVKTIIKFDQLNDENTDYDEIKYKKIRQLSKSNIVMGAVLLILLLLTIYTFLTMKINGINVAKGFKDTFYNFFIMFTQPYSHRFTIGNALYEVLITVGLAFLTTLFGAVIAVFLGLLSAQNLSSSYVSKSIKAVVSFIRAVPTVLWVLIFAVAAGLGSEAAVIGMTFHSVSYLTKAYSESFESLDKSVIEALKASGANWWQIVFQAVIPSSSTYMLSWTFMRFEINFTNAVAMGAAAGAGGIGFDLFMASGYYFDLREVGLITYLILAVAFILEIISTKTKKKLMSC